MKPEYDDMSLLEKARSLRVETAALLRATQTVFGREDVLCQCSSIPEEWMAHYHQQVYEKLNILQMNARM